MYLQYNLIYHLLPNFYKASYTISASIFVDFRIDHPIAQISSSLVLYRIPRSGSFTLAKRSQSHALRRKRRHFVVQIPIIVHENARSHVAVEGGRNQNLMLFIRIAISGAPTVSDLFRL